MLNNELTANIQEEKALANKQIAISFCLPVYNVKPFLQDCIVSIIDACDSDLKYEILCMDDGSTDGSYEYLLELKERFSALVVLKNEKNSGASYTRNRLVREAKGKYIWFVDPDDVMCKDVAARFYQKIEELQCDVLLGNFIRIDENSDLKCREAINIDFTVPPSKKRVFYPISDTGTAMCALWAGIFKKSFLIDNNLTMNEAMIVGEDTLFYYEFSLKTDNIFKWEIPCYLYRQRKSSVMHAHSEERNKKYYISMREMLRAYEYHLEIKDYKDLSELLNKIHHSKQNVSTCLAALYDKKYIKEQLAILKKEGVYPYKFRKDAFKAPQNFLFKLLVFLLPIKPFFWLYHYLYVFKGKKRL